MYYEEFQFDIFRKNWNYHKKAKNHYYVGCDCIYSGGFITFSSIEKFISDYGLENIFDYDVNRSDKIITIAFNELKI